MKYHLYDRGQFIGFFTLFWVLVCLLLISLTNVSSGGGSWAWPMIMLISLLSAIPLPLNMANSNYISGQTWTTSQGIARWVVRGNPLMIVT